MYRDLPNLSIIRGDDADALLFILINKFRHEYDEAKIVGFPRLDMNENGPLEKQFYRLAGINFSKKWDSFYVERDPSREKALYEKIDPGANYVFLHDDSRFVIDRDKVLQNPIVSPGGGITDNVFDFCTLIERAQEIHVIDSSFMFLVDLLAYQNPNQKLFVHRYARPNPPWSLPALKKKWTILT
jgi:hypothetical protein